MSWLGQALCAQVGDPELWFPKVGQPGTAARKICDRCSVQAECELLWRSLPAEMRLHGIWAGRSTTQRREDAPIPRVCRGCDQPARPRNPWCSTDCAKKARAEAVRRYEEKRRYTR